MIAIMFMPMEDLWNIDARERSLAAGEVLFRAGDPVQLLYRVEGGAVRLIRPLTHGSELTLQRVRAGSLLAEASLFAAAYHCDAVAETPARLRGIPVKRVMQALENDSALTRALAQYLALEAQSARARAEIVSLKTVAARLDAWLALNNGPLPPKGRWREVAEEIGVTPEALYRELARRR
jgi:CRP/FNR family transcriptional regulator, dissimilatory nitrate respiration regulator